MTLNMTSISTTLTCMLKHIQNPAMLAIVLTRNLPLISAPTMGGNPMTWRSHKLRVVLFSSAKVEYQTMANVSFEMLWVHRPFQKLGSLMHEAMSMFCNNSAIIFSPTIPPFMSAASIFRSNVGFFKSIIYLSQKCILNC